MQNLHGSDKEKVPDSSLQFCIPAFYVTVLIIGSGAENEYVFTPCCYRYFFRYFSVFDFQRFIFFFLIARSLCALGGCVDGEQKAG